MLQHIPICSEAATLAVKGCGSEWPFHSLKISLCGQLNVNADKWEVSECWFTGNASHVSHVKCNRCLHLFRVHFKCHLLVVSAVAVAALVMFSLLDYSIYNMCPRVRLIATPCCTVHNKSNTVLPPSPPFISSALGPLSASHFCQACFRFRLGNSTKRRECEQKSTSKSS